MIIRTNEDIYITSDGKVFRSYDYASAQDHELMISIGSSIKESFINGDFDDCLSKSFPNATGVKPVKKLKDKHGRVLEVGDDIVCSYKTHDNRFTVELGVIEHFNDGIIYIDVGWSYMYGDDSRKMLMQVNPCIQDVIKLKRAKK